MYITTCWVYENLEMDLRTETDAIHIGLRCKNKDTNINVTMGKEQATSLVAALSYTLQQMGTTDPLHLSGSATWLQKEVA